ncbi:hypothetical protein HOLleu_40299 [Holothuria leucospilota]|uniref:CCHC-type domain-containing protein n=1 Tax=Holothuria leucospilota TaxID=206669 RepID=A0A9Q0YF13_HOLLE|nr:hypothetical protein HOLleu_40299 [Holothuria leucospilota]
MEGSRGSWLTLDDCDEGDLIQLTPRHQPGARRVDGGETEGRHSMDWGSQQEGRTDSPNRSVLSQVQSPEGGERFSPRNPFNRLSEEDAQAKAGNYFARQQEELTPRDEYPRLRDQEYLTGDGPFVRGTTGIRPGTYDGSSAWEDYRAQFEVVAELHHWSPAVMAMCLAASLRGEAQSVLADLHVDARRDYQSLVNALSRRFDPAHQTEVFRIQLKNRNRKKDETLPELAQEIRRLSRQAYPAAPSEVQALMSKDHFVDALDDSDVRLAVYQARLRNLDEALRVALEMEAFQTVEKQRTFLGKKALRTVEGPNTRSVTPSMSTDSVTDCVTKAVTDGMKRYQGALGDMKEMVKALKEEVQTLQEKVKRDSGRGRRWGKGSDRGPSHTEDGVPICFKCREPGHFKRDCPKPTEARNDQQGTPDTTILGNSQLSGLGVVSRQ